ncbi:hypothetical protein C1645_765076 [Glomus cerebriforme]|uniref:HMG box domain-containing protein n=1 Tax=Glomus cerebriforme TaxID=658196 RepID=A0A397TBS6_9GLOM|nr:hypothetical protein C1645_765076 [Glomus cerebriforme]
MTRSNRESTRNVRNVSNKKKLSNVKTKKKSSKQKNVNSKRNSSKREEITVDLPFPPDIRLEKFFPSKYTVSLRTLNAFIIYRKVVTAEIKKSHTLCWSSISSIASKKWSLEDAQVKQHYKELAEKTKALYRSKHLFYVHQGKNAAGSIMFQDNETTENSPKTFTFVYSEYENNSSNLNNEVAKQENAFSEQIESDTAMSIDVNSHVLPNENEQNIIPSVNADPILDSRNYINLINMVNMYDFPMTSLLHDDGFSFPFEMANDNMF